MTTVTEGVCASHRLASDPAFLKLLKSDLVKKGDEGATCGAADEARATSERAMRTGDGQKTLFNWAAFLLPPSICVPVCSADAKAVTFSFSTGIHNEIPRLHASNRITLIRQTSD